MKINPADLNITPIDMLLKTMDDVIDAKDEDSNEKPVTSEPERKYFTDFKSLKEANDYLKENSDLDLVIFESNVINKNVANLSLQDFKVIGESGYKNPVFSKILGIDSELQKSNIYYLAVFGENKNGLYENAYISDKVNAVYKFLILYDYNEAVLFQINIENKTYESYEIYPFSDEIQDRFISQSEKQNQKPTNCKALSTVSAP